MYCMKNNPEACLSPLASNTKDKNLDAYYIARYTDKSRLHHVIQYAM